MKHIAGTIREVIDSSVESKIAPDGYWEDCFTIDSLADVIDESINRAVDTVVWEAVKLAGDWD